MLELGEAEYMVRTTGYLKSIDDFNQVVIAARSGVPVLLSDVASVRRDRRSGAASPSSTARARWRAGLSLCARVKTRSAPLTR
ncbi:Cobalt-zinc-cadmium resistance protein CzcA, Cation efflux system protein CusA [Klebsiella michiganensis]|uniref:Cobalt-zinc-cadmium resistance protein CzcA, Cation efflux system protein CusA n=1 Tax=Klebsiella michiganensis TaxID=1134687 RepID=A0A7H4LS70_9ENTR|nr:Cobalt-zinc-cadmium resistance protein CzcA, Cation efflux system protein CusA [Klebsiella michiganensis]